VCNPDVNWLWVNQSTILMQFFNVTKNWLLIFKILSIRYAGYTVKVVIIKSNVMRHLSPAKLHVAVLKNLHKKGTSNVNVTHEIPYLSFENLVFKSSNVPHNLPYLPFYVLSIEIHSTSNFTYQKFSLNKTGAFCLLY
jgi:hypothetical protein